MGRPGCLLEAPGAPREARPPKAAQRHSKETVWVVWKCLLEVSGPPLGSLRAPKGTPKSLQGRGQYEASDLKLIQTKTSELKLQKQFSQGHWSSRAEAELAKRKQFGFEPATTSPTRAAADFLSWSPWPGVLRTTQPNRMAKWDGRLARARHPR